MRTMSHTERKISVSLNSHYENFINENVMSGRYTSTEDVIVSALKLLEIEENKLQYPLSIDTALEAIGFIINATVKELQHENNPEQIQILRNKIKLLNREMQIIYGLEGDEETRVKIYNKVNDIYCPQIKSNVLLTPEYEYASD